MSRQPNAKPEPPQSTIEQAKQQREAAHQAQQRWKTTLLELIESGEVGNAEAATAMGLSRQAIWNLVERNRQTADH